MLIVKWSFINDSKDFKEPLTRITFNRILSEVHSLGDLVKLPSEHHNIHNFIRNIAYQQFIYQYDFSFLHISRNSFLFAKLPDNHNLKRLFKKKHGLECNEFINLTITLIAFFIEEKKHTIELGFFSPLYERYSKETIQKFLNSISVDINSLKNRLIKNDLSKGHYSEFYEQSSFIRYPLLRNNQKYTCTHPFLLFRCLEHFLYDTLKEDDPEKFMRSFGKIFETYLIKGLDYSGLEYIKETELKRFLPKEIKCIDYIIKQEKFNILIDAKGVEMPYLGKVSDNPQVILGKVKNSAIKALEQASEFNNYLLNGGNNNLPEFRKKSCLLVVTYKELYLGNGQLLYDTVAKEKIDNINSKINEKAKIDLKRVYFITIESFDLIMSLVKNHNMDIGNILESAIANDIEPLSKKFEFSQHIHSRGCNPKCVNTLLDMRSNLLLKFDYKTI